MNMMKVKKIDYWYLEYARKKEVVEVVCVVLC